MSKNKEFNRDIKKYARKNKLALVSYRHNGLKCWALCYDMDERITYWTHYLPVGSAITRWEANRYVDWFTYNKRTAIAREQGIFWQLYGTGDNRFENVQFEGNLNKE